MFNMPQLYANSRIGVFLKRMAFLALFLVFQHSLLAQTRAAYFVGYNSSTATFPIAAAGITSTVATSATINFSGLTTYNDSRCVWTNPNAATTLNTATAPYLSYTINFKSGHITFDRFVMTGLAEFSTATLQLRWSVDNYASSLGQFTINGSSYTLSSVNLSSQGSIAVNGALVFRVYFYNTATQVFNSDTGPYASLDGTPSSYGAFGQNVAIWYSSFTVLPLTMLSFTAQQQNGQVDLQWSTSEEQNTKDFVIQHSTDGAVWNSIGTINAAGNSTSVRSYSFSDTHSANGLNYYRLLQQDLDNKSTFSDIITLNCDVQSPAFEILGNPVIHGTLQIKLQKDAVVAVYNEAGQLLLKGTFSSGQHAIDVTRYPK
jgi:hypothetical protein